MQRIRLEGEIFEAETNSFLLTTGSDTVSLLDTGIGTPNCESQLRAALEGFSLSMSDIDCILLTHFHYDHAGLASTIQQEAAATVYCHSADAPLVAGTADRFLEEIVRKGGRLATWGVPSRKRDELRHILEASASLGGGPVEVTSIADGETVSAGGHEVIVHHLPGHTAGHVAYEIDDSTVVVGDLLHPTKTPNVGGDYRLDNPIAAYLASLTRLSDMEPKEVWPGHGESIQRPTKRINEIIEHHYHRSRQVLDIIDTLDGGRPWAVAQEMFGDLSGIHVLNGVGEAAAHLAFLASVDAVDQVGDAFHHRTNNRDIAPEFPRFP